MQAGPGAHRQRDEALAVRTTAHGGMRWLDLTRPTAAEVEALREEFGFHPLDIEDVLGALQRPKLDEYDDYLFLVLHFPVFDSARQVTTASEVNLFIGPDYLVTLHPGDLWPIGKLFEQVSTSERLCAEHLGSGPGYLLYKLLDKLVDNGFPIVYKMERNVQAVETKIFEARVRETVFELSTIRRDIIAFRRVIKPLLPVVARLEYLKTRMINEDHEVYFSDISDALGKIWDSLEDLKTITESLNDAHMTLTSHQTSEVMKLLTLINVILLPLTLISGIYGMNIALPFAHSPWAFTGVVGSMLAVVGAMLAFFRWRRWV